jgi:adenosine kinase
MTVLISGSVAIDTVLASPFPFALDASQVAAQRLAVSYYMPKMDQVWGGCAANIAYALKQLGGTPLVMATVGSDAQAYLDRLAGLGISCECVLPVAGEFTAKAVIMTDSLAQQITGFHPGAMNHAHIQSAVTVLAKYSVQWAIVSPDGKTAMLQRSRELAKAGVKFIADPGQATPIMDAADFDVLLHGAALLAVNEHEAAMMEATLGASVAQLSERLPVLVTLGNAGLVLWEHGQPNRLSAVTGLVAVDPTGCGDSLRGAVLHALTLGWSVLNAIKLGNLMGAYKVQHAGGQGYTVTMNDLQAMWAQHYSDAFPI